MSERLGDGRKVGVGRAEVVGELGEWVVLGVEPVTGGVGEPCLGVVELLAGEREVPAVGER